MAPIPVDVKVFVFDLRLPRFYDERGIALKFIEAIACVSPEQHRMQRTVPESGNRARTNEVASFGDHLRQAREERNMTLQEIAATTKIGSRSLQALEDERFDLLPGGIFNKGFVRAYARCVGLNEDKTVAEYLAATKVPVPETDMQALASQVSAAGEVANEPWPVSAASLMGILAVIVALGLGALWLKEHRKEVLEQAAVEHRAVSQVASTAAPALPPQAQAAPVEAAASTAADAAKPGASSMVQGSGEATKPMAGAATPPVAAAPAVKERTAQVASGQGTEPVEISISATKRAWISVQSDGKTVETLTLDPDKPELRSRSYKAREKLMLTVGNPAGLTVTYNGKPAGSLGAAGQRATITFTPRGIEKQ
jgi:cytoskeleton protein RodZ